MKLIAICAMSDNRCIGIDNTIPWSIKRDMLFFKETTMGHPVIMGKNTYLSLPNRLTGRREIVISSTLGTVPGVEVYKTLEEAINVLKEEEIKIAFIIGGSTLYRESMSMVDEIYLTVIHKEITGDSYFPKIPMYMFELLIEEYHDVSYLNQYPLTFQTYRRIK